MIKHLRKNLKTIATFPQAAVRSRHIPCGFPEDSPCERIAGGKREVKPMKNCFVTTVLIALLGLLSLPALAQEFRGAVTGAVTDMTGAIVPNAKVKLTDTATGVTSTTSTNAAGIYTVDLLPIGPYDVRVDMSGFEISVSHIGLHTGERLQVDVQLHPGTAVQTVTVTSDAPQLETTNGGTIDVLGEQQIADEPMLGRNPFAMAGDVAGVTMFPGQNPLFANSPYANGGMDSWIVNGGLAYTTEYLLDGLTDSGIDTGGPANLSFVPSPDEVQEVGIATSILDAQYGRSGGGIVSVNLKSGTNRLRGEASYYLRNEMFNANSYADDTIGARKGEFRWLEPSVEVDGPVFIPKLYDGRNRTFFMFGWEEIHNEAPAPSYISVPTALERQGNFSQSFNGNPLPIYDPLTTVSNGAGGYTRTAFPNNTIPTNRLDPVAQKIAALLPLPNVPGAYNVNNLLATPNTSGDRYDSFVYRLDHNINQNNKIFGAFMYADRHQNEGLDAFPVAIAPSYLHWRINHAAHVDWTSTISPTLISSFRVGWNEHQFGIANHQQNFDLSTIGWPAATIAGLSDPTLFPYLSIGGYTSFGNSGFASGLLNTSNTYDLAESLIKHLKKMDLNFGVEIRPARDSRSWEADSTNFGFGTDFTQANPLTSQTDSGSGFASFLLGYADSGSNSYSPSPYYENGYYAAYVQDNWRLTSRLALTLGLRWDTETPEIESHNQQNTGFDPDAPYVFAGQQLFGKVLFPGVNGGQRGAYGYNLNYFGPRVGFSYSLTPKAVIRGGVGILYAPVFNQTSETGFSANTNYVASTNNLLTPDCGACTLGSPNTFANPFPNGFVQPGGAASNLTGQGGWTYWNANKANTPKIIQSSLGVEYQLPAQTLLNVKYVLGLTRHISETRNANFLPTSDLALGNALNGTVPNPFSGLLPGTFLNTPTITLQQSLLPFPQYSPFYVVVSNAATSYNALQVTLDKRVSHGLYGRVAYTYSKENAEGFLNDQDTKYTHELNPDDQPHMITVTAGWHIPTPGEWSTSRILRQVMGWQVSGTYESFPKSGQLYTAPAGVTSTGVNPHVSHPTFAHEFNTCTIQLDGSLANCSLDNNIAAWKVVPPFTLATLNPYYGALRMPEPQLTNVDISKIFSLGKGLKLQFRAQAFNLTNSPAFTAPNTTYSSSTFGQVTNFSQYNDPRELMFALKLMY